MTSNSENRRHAIIAGVNKCGTTSVFRYLSNHPEVCASSVKETRFFIRCFDETESPTYENYLANFQLSDREQVLLEASPTYFSSGREVGDRIADFLPNARIVVLLREPIDRLFSYYRSALVYDNFQTEMLRGVSFGKFVDIALSSYRDKEIEDPTRREFVKALKQGCYIDHIRSFASQFPTDRTSFFFFEELVDDAKNVMKSVCKFLELDEQYFENYEFRVENKTRAYRSIALQKIIFRTNMRFEKVFNRLPGLRKRAQLLYRAINERKRVDSQQINSESYEKLHAFYREGIGELRACLAESYGVAKFPAWVEQN